MRFFLAQIMVLDFINLKVFVIKVQECKVSVLGDDEANL